MPQVVTVQFTYAAAGTCKEAEKTLKNYLKKMKNDYNQAANAQTVRSISSVSLDKKSCSGIHCNSLFEHKKQSFCLTVYSTTHIVRI